MKKSLIYTTAASFALLAGVVTTILFNNANAEPSTSEASPLTTLTDQTSLGAALTPNKNETVYVITDQAGAPTKTFIGSTLESSASNLPVDLNIKYYLDDKEISAADLAGQSGHVKIVFNYSTTAKYQDKLVPFLSLTGLQLDGTKFKNVKVTNGKIISEGDNITVAGYALAGLNYDLGTDLLPESFTLEADATNFELGTTYTLATNEIFTDLDTSKLSTVDDLVNSMNQLGSGINQILIGSQSLENGISQLANGITALQSGASDLNNGANQLAEGASKLSTKVSDQLAPSIIALDSGLSSLSANSANITSGAMQIFQALLDSTSAEIGIQLTPENYTTVLTNIINNPATPASVIVKLTQAKYLFDSYANFYAGLNQYTGNVDYIATQTPALSAGAKQLASGTADLADGANQLLDGTVALKTGVDTLASGASQLSSGSQSLTSGIATFKSSGIDRLVNFANQNLANFTANVRATISAAKSYKNYKSPNATSVKFIFKTPSIK